MNIKLIKKTYFCLLANCLLLASSTLQANSRSILGNLTPPTAKQETVKPITVTVKPPQPVQPASATPVKVSTPVSSATASNAVAITAEKKEANTQITTTPAVPAAPIVNEQALAPTVVIPTKSKNSTTTPNPLAKESKSHLRTEEQDFKKQKETDTKDLESIKNNQIINFYFEDATLENLVRYIEQLFDIKFFADDDIEPTPQGGAVLKGHKLTFKTYQPLTRDEAWNLFLKFLDIAGLTVVPTENNKIYYITSITNANSEVLITYFNSKLEDIPDNSGKIRYVFFAKNAPLTTINKIVTSFSSSTAKINAFPELNAMIIIDKGSSIKSLMHIVHEFDKEVPECMSVLKLKRADAQDVAKLYADLTAAESPQGIGKFFSAKNQPQGLFFPNTRLIPEPRTNSLIILGAQESITKIEDFIKTHIDKTLDMPYSPLYIYELQYTQAENMQRILSSVVDFGASSIAGQHGGIRDGDQYFKPMTITADVDGNRLIIKAEENDYLKVKEIIKKLDVLQPQVAIEVLIVNVEVTDKKELGAQIRQKVANQPFENVEFATSGLSTGQALYQPVMPQSGSSLMGNLMALANNQLAGSTLLSLGSNLTGGVWAMLRVLETFGKTDVISNPFLLTTNGYTAKVMLGSTRRIQTSTSLSAGAAQQGVQPIDANLTVVIKPQISTDGSIQMGISINIVDFSDSALTNGNTFNKMINTTAIVNDKEILVLGGVVKSTTSVAMRKTPILGDIPVLGWFFRNKEKTKSKSNLLIFISPHIIFHDNKETGKTYTRDKTSTVRDLMGSSVVSSANNSKDPINKMFFDDEADKTLGFLNNMTPHEHLFDAKKPHKKHKKDAIHNTENAAPKKLSRKEKLKEKRAEKKQQAKGQA